MTDELKARLRAIKHVALDMDGTIYLGSTLFPYTIPFLEKLDRLGIGYSFLTNNPTKSIDAYLENLRKRGVPCRPDQMYSSAVATVDYIRNKYPDIFLIADAKRGDIGNTARMYAKAFFEEMDFDAVTLAPYMGKA